MNAPAPHSPRETFALHGHDAAMAAFQDSRRSGRLHHAWLLHGPMGIGKATLAFHFARILLNGVDPQSPAGRRITAGTHADLMVIGRGMDERKGRLRSEIVADEVRPIQSFLRRTAAEGGWRVVIIDGAEFMNRHAANALLKLLEEPPPQAALFLVSAAPGALLPTLRSRCRALTCLPLSNDDMRQVLHEQGYATQDVDRLIEAAHGSPGRAAFLGHDRDGRVAGIVGKWLDGGASGASPGDAESIVRQDEGFALLCDLLGDGLSQRARRLAETNSLADAARVAAAHGALAALRRETERFNLDKGQAVLQAATIVSDL
ncbi:DNA polymerase III subunit delta' [Neoasaia chiangmaiensis NBRC 101099]|uniref:DNA polymerase III subunit delta n=1 Tax=Neoasaia chiangmaiensis TaxID=320497 RepID=A0A1U9KML4_9PROT|nr:DNA polymerase III subunit delta' [Neoasaia chiangmaiensis]AQS87041.1 DNA polymerase III subunit delta' [Neoasaia chiangmaiensis]GBR37906.1 DNA polymerase III subunit delta' [Neoasaia chiangmaiensis NBRC 101099]GEN15179.1 DNA polymerase III subunit delta' [Neoasaia chiangmaiensis]